MARESRDENGKLMTPLKLLGAALCLQLMSAVVFAQQRATDDLLSRLSSRSSTNLKVSFIYSPKYPVVGKAVQFVDASSGNPTSWAWDFGDGTTSTERNPLHVYSRSGFRKAVLTVTNGTVSKKVSRTLTVLPNTTEATFVFSPATPGPGQTVQFADTTSGNPTSWRWNFGDSGTSTVKNPSHAFARAGSYTVSLTTTEGSSTKQGSKTLTIAGMSVLTSSFTYSPASPTVGQAIQFTDTSTGTPTSWSWNFGDGGTSTSQHPGHTYSAAGTKTVTLTVANGSGSNTSTQTVTVGVALAASFTYSPASPAVGQAIQFTDTSTGIPTSWSWNFGDGGTSTSQNPSHTYTTAGAKTVTLTVTNNSGSNTASRTLTVAVALAASFTYSPASPAVGQAIQFSDTSTGTPTSWSWNFGDGGTSTSQNPSHTYATAGSKTITLTVSNTSGSNSTSRTLTVSAALAASFTYSPASPSVGQSIQFTDTSTGSPTSWSWSFGDGATSSAQNPAHAYASAASYTVSLTATTGSNSQTASMSITVTPAATLDASFTFSPAAPSPGQAVAFRDTSNGVPTSWQWNFGDGGSSTIQNPSHSYAAEGSYAVTLIVSNASGSDTISRTVVVATSSDAIPADRLYDWASYSGIPGGIPNRTTIYQSFSSGASSSSIQSAIASCPAGQVVYLGPGTYSSLTITSAHQCTLRGAGPGQTIVSGRIYLNGGSIPADAGTWSNTRALASGYTKGSMSITLATAPGSGFAVGNLIQITQNDDYVLVFHRTGNWAGTKNLRFTSRITSVSGNTIGLATPIPYSYSAGQNPICMSTSTSVVLCGVEDMTINGESPIVAEGTDRCWIKGLELTGYDNAGATFQYGNSQSEMRRCYSHDPAGFPNSDGYWFFMQYGGSCFRIEDNIAAHVASGILNSGAGGFIGYNYVYDTRGGGVQPTWIAVAFRSNHGPHSIMNLWEGNVGSRYQNDGYHGSGSHQVLFRNNFNGLDGPVGNTGERQLVDSCRGSYYESVVGNVLGDPSWVPYAYEAPRDGADHNRGYIYVLGWGACDSTDPNNSDTPAWENFTPPGGSYPDTNVAATMIRHANYDYYNRMTLYQSGKSQAIPSSLVYASKPSYFGSLQWPPIGPDVGGLATAIPAQARWNAYLSSGSLADLFR
jgi:PKD repeat protein